MQTRAQAAEQLKFQAGLLDAVEQAVIVTDLDWKVTYWNRFAESMYGWSRAEALGRSIGELLVPQISEARARAIMSRVAEGESWSGEFVVRRRDGTSFTCLVTDSPLRDASGTLVGVIGISMDITASKQAEDVQSRLAAVVTCSKDAIIAFGLDAAVTDWNSGAQALYGYSAAEMIGRGVQVLMAPGKMQEAAAIQARVAGGEKIEQFETVRVHKDGHLIEVSMSIAPIRSASGAMIGGASIARDITSRKTSDAAVAYQALHDGLTGLANRSLLHTRLEQVVRTARDSGASTGLLLLDLDRFKEVNDTLGHQVGDVLLQQIGQRLQVVALPTDLVARLGGDEFAVLLPDADVARASQVAAALVRILQRPFVLAGQPIAVDASIGIALAPGHGQDADTLLRCADVAMYQAKRSGTGVALYSAEDDQNSPDRLALLGELRDAIENDELLLYYQPKLDLHDGTLVGVEALVRWQHPQRGFLPPSEFIPLAEQTGLIYPLSLWVLGAALKQHRLWRALGIDVPVAVNLSRRILHDPQLPDMVARLLAQWDMAPSGLILEITESSLMADPVRAGENLRQLRALGIRMSIDDFGTGYSSLASLKNLSVDELKIDQSFVQAMASDASSRAIVRAIIDLADALQLRVVAEGVEDRPTWDVLAGLGCDVAQGYFLSRPIAAADFETWVVQASPAWLADAERSQTNDALQARIRGRGARLTAEEEFVARKQAEAALVSSEERNRLALQAGGMGTWDWDVVSGLVRWSVETEQLTGLAPGAFDGTLKGFSELVHPDDWAAALAEIDASIAEHRDSLYAYRTRQPRADGSARWIEARGRGLYDPDGHLLRVTGTHLDISERKLVEEALRASEERFRRQYKGMPVPTYSWLQVGEDFVLQDYNDSAQATAESDLSGWLGIRASKRYANEPAVMADLRACVAEQRTVQREVRYRYPDSGRERDLSVTYVFVPPQTVMLHSEDITEAKLAEQQREAMAQSEKLRALGQMATGIAHDLNQSLMLVASYSDLAQQALVQDPPDLDALQDLLITTTQAALDGGDSVKRLLLFTRAAPEQDDEPVDLSTVVRDAALLTAPRWRDEAQIEGRPISLIVESAGQPAIHGSPARLRELMTNLIFNAVDALPTGGSIRLRVIAEDGVGVVEVADSGLGMSPDVQAHVFEPFFTTKGEGGSGLGLSMAFGIVEQHDGHISIQSAPGDGTTIRITFPLVAADASAELAPGLPPAALLDAAPPARLRVLAVDDEPMMTRALVRMLRPSGHLVIVAGSGEEALVKLSEQTFDVVVSDMGMGPGMNGWELAETVGRRWPSMRFLLATGWGAAIDPAEARTRGVEAVLAKPYRSTDLLQALASTHRAA